MTQQRQGTRERRPAKLHQEPPPEPSKVIDEREIPSEVALVTPLIIRVTDFLLQENVLSPSFKNKFQLCLDEALRNAIVHGNRKDFSKKVKLQVFVQEDRWGVLVSDQGSGFVLDRVPDPLEETGLWGETGRGIRLIEHYMDEVDYWAGGRVLVMTKFL